MLTLIKWAKTLINRKLIENKIFNSIKTNFHLIIQMTSL